MSEIVNCVRRVAGRELVYHTIPVRTIAFYTGIEYSRGKIAIFPLPNDNLSEDQELPKSWSCELVQKQWAKKLKKIEQVLKYQFAFDWLSMSFIFSISRFLIQLTNLIIGYKYCASSSVLSFVKIVLKVGRIVQNMAKFPTRVAQDSDVRITIGQRMWLHLSLSQKLCFQH